MYESFYSLKSKPFQLHPDPRFFYGSKGHKRAMAYLEYGLAQGEGFIVITGEVGAGKTTLVRNLFKKLETKNIVAAQLVSTQLEADDLLQMVVAAFGLTHENLSKPVLLKKLEGFLLSCSNQGKRALLVVDEAQNLSPKAVEELRMLSNFQTADKSLLQSFLLGQPEFRYILQSEGMQQLRQRVIASYHLGPMDAAETQAYIEHRLKTAGWNDDPSFDEGAFNAIFAYSGGIPRKINTLCDRLLLYGFLEEKRQFDELTVKEVCDDLVEEGSAPFLAPVAIRKGNGLNGSSVVDNMDAINMLSQKIEQLDQSMTALLHVVKKLLPVASERLEETKAGEHRD